MTRPGPATLANTGAGLTLAALAWLAGVALQLRQPELFDTIFYLAAGTVALGVVATGAALIWLASRRPAGPRAGSAAQLAAVSAVLAAIVTLGFSATGWRAAERLAEALPAALEGADLRVTGIVASLPQRGASGLRFRFEVESAQRFGQPVVPASLPSLLAIGWYKGFHEDAVLSQPQQELAAGQRWQFTLRLRQPHGNLNPHGFDSELYLFEQGVRAVGYVRDAPPAQLLARAAAHPVERWRQQVRDAIEARVPDRRISGVLAALAVGDQSAIERDDWALYRDTGIAHLVSISGLHVTMFAWLAGAAIAALWRRSRRAALWLPAPLAGLWGGLAAALAYAVFSGWGVPSQRTVWMLAAVTLLRSGGCRWPWPLTLLAAAVAVTAHDPWALLQAGFWLSFMAVGLLLASGGAGGVADPSPAAADPPDAAASAVSGDPPGSAAGSAAAAAPRCSVWQRHALTAARHLHGGVRTQLIATIGLAPLTLVFFQQLSLVGFLANLVAIPVITLLVTPLALLGTLAWPMWAAGAWAVRALNAWLQWLAGWPGAVWWAPVAPAWAQLAGLAAAALLVMPLPWRVRVLAVPLLLPLLLPPADPPAEGQFELLVVDVGQGTAVLLRTRTHLLVYDSGPQVSRDSDAGQRVLLPLLRARGEPRIDLLLLSHRDTDHTGGAASLLRGIPVAALTTSIEAGHPLLLDAAARGIPASRCAAGQRWRWDGVEFMLLAPPLATYGDALKPNALSCVLQVRGSISSSRPEAPSVLLTGDIERAQELALVETLATGLHSSVLVVPHHGSKTSSSAAFIDAVSPRIAVLQAGYRSRFGHPAPEVLARYAERGVPAPASPSCGAWQWRTDQRAEADFEAATQCERERARRYWHHRAMPVALPVVLPVSLPVSSP